MESLNEVEMGWMDGWMENLNEWRIDEVFEWEEQMDEQVEGWGGLR